MFKCAVVKELTVAGRHSIVKEADVKQVLCTPGGGPPLIAEMCFQ